MKNSIRTVTPKLAAAWLTKNFENRPLREITVASFAAAMKAGEWILNGDAIRFNCNDRLIDGQKRLHACVRAGVSFRTYVIEGLPETAFDTIDQGDLRTISDVFARRAVKHYKLAAATVRMVDIINNDDLIGRAIKLRPPAANKILDDNPEIVDSASTIVGCQAGKLMAGGMAAAIHYLGSRKHPDKANEFWTAVGIGENLKRGYPAHTLREKLIDNKSSDAKFGREVVMEISIRAWNAFVEGRKITRLIIKGDRPEVM